VASLFFPTFVSGKNDQTTLFEEIRASVPETLT
jgi:hypothetical protein